MQNLGAQQLTSCRVRLDSASLADLREVASNNDLSGIEGLSITQLTIGAVVELTCIRAAASVKLRLILDRWAKTSPTLGHAFLTLEHGALPSTSDLWTSRAVDFFPIRGPNWADDQHFHPFESRFRKAATEAGFGRKADALTAALREMADNVAQHSGPSSRTPSPGLVGYYASDGHVAFAVGDAGRGVLASLHENPAWTHLTNSRDALVAVVNDHASRRPNLGNGEGFKQIFRWLADLNGFLVLASGDGRMQLRQTADGRQAMPGFSGAFPGLQLSINCSLAGPPDEKTIPFDTLT